MPASAIAPLATDVELTDAADAAAAAPFARPQDQLEWMQWRVAELEARVFGRGAPAHGDEPPTSSEAGTPPAATDATSGADASAPTATPSAEAAGADQFSSSASQSSLPERAAVVRQRLDAVQDEPMARFFKKLRAMEPFLGSPGDPPRLTPASEDLSVKESILLSSYDAAASASKAFKELKAMERHINPAYLRDMPELIARLERVQSRQAAIDLEANALHRRVDRLLSEYNECVNLVSTKFLAAHSTLEALEGQRA
jgi:hypothetical protein